MSRRRRRGQNSSNIVAPAKKALPRFWKVIWIIVAILLFVAITSFTGFYAPDIYMLMIFGLIVIFLNIYAVYLLYKDRKVDP